MREDQQDDSGGRGDGGGGGRGGGGSYDPYARIRALYQQITGGKYTPSDTDVAQWGTNIDDQYLQSIGGAISNWWQQYQSSQPTTPAAPQTAPSGGGGGGGGLPSLGYRPLSGTPTSWTANPTAPSWNAIPAFQAPTMEQAANDPGYKFGLQQGEQALQQSQAAQGLLNSGGSLKDILAWGQNYATQRYGDVFNRQKSIYDTNTQTQYLDPYQAAMSQWQTQMAATQNQNQFLTGANLNQWWNQWQMYRDALTA